MTQVAPQRVRRAPGDHDGTGRHTDSGYGPPPTSGRLRGRHAAGGDHGFGGLVLWTILGSLLPGAGLLAAGLAYALLTVLAWRLRRSTPA